MRAAITVRFVLVDLGLAPVGGECGGYATVLMSGDGLPFPE
jgi:hypothetical protein